ncbi:MAG: hypothetical protein BGO70_16100 [Bacteroidetes bacterium 43-93]|nr:hypothetical protein [Bacteroidota bacterium]OJX01290.1 MAG: hypothetical protein BGO70_16100 [Bacteroidetes bacterium 43-93]
MTVLTTYFSQRSYGTQHLNIFRRMAHTIISDYLREMKEYVEDKGFPPSFEEMMSAAKRLENDLLLKGDWLKLAYKKERGKGSPSLSKGVKRIIKGALNDYINRTKAITPNKPKEVL